MKFKACPPPPRKENKDMPSGKGMLGEGELNPK